MTETPTSPHGPAGPADPPPPGDDQGPRTSGEEVRDLGRIRRSTTDKKVAGVAGGLARHLDVDPVILRVAFVVLTFFGGAGLIAYAAGWLLLPMDDGSEGVIRMEDRNRAVVLTIVTVLAGLAIVAELAGDAWGPFWFPWQLAAVAVIAAVLINRHERRRSAPPAPPQHGPQYGPQYGAQYGQQYGYGQSAQGWVGEQAPPAGRPAPEQAPQQTWLAPPQTWMAPPPPPPVFRDPRRRGPRLFWFTAALVTLALGVLGTVDLAGASVADGAYPALALGVIGTMLVVGSFFGRAGGLILVGLLTVPVLLGATAADRIDTEPLQEAPTSAASLDPSYRMGVGELVIDLRGIEDLDELDGRVLDITVQVGRIEVLVPRDLTVEATATVHGPGEIRLFGEQRGGIDTQATETHDGGPGSPVLQLDAETNLGEIVVRTR